jgi:predicted metalloprotease with PDZ domain
MQLPTITSVLSLATLIGTSVAAAQSMPDRTRDPEVSNVRYSVRFDANTALARQLEVSMRFDVASDSPVQLSLPTWTPGAYEVSNFAKYVSGFDATAGDAAIDWDKVDFDTWRIHPTAPGTVTISFAYTADTLDNAQAWARPDFAFFNGTNVFLWPESLGYDFSASVSIETEADWHVATGMSSTGPRTYQEESFHALVDTPVFVGRFDFDSTEIDGRTYRLATYPAGVLQGASRNALWREIGQVVPVQVAVFGETPWADYTTLLVFDPNLNGSGSALEHSNSHIGIYDHGFIDNPVLALITAHEIFHAWNVKRLRPADLVPYDYDQPQPTTLLWVSEGITDYYADLSLIRGGVLPPPAFYQLTAFKINGVADVPAVALEDASLSTWIQPTDGTATTYYEKGSLVGLLLDIMIRDATANRASLDTVLRRLYETTYKQERGFTLEEWWATVREVSGIDSFDDFYARYIDGREPFPYAEILPKAGMRLMADTVRAPFVGLSHEETDEGIRVSSVTPGESAARAGVREGDVLISVGEIAVGDLTWGEAFRNRYRGQAVGAPYTIVVRRDGAERTLPATLGYNETIQYSLTEDPRASPTAMRIREGILRGVANSR